MFNYKGMLKYSFIGLILLLVPVLINITFQLGSKYNLYNIGFNKGEILVYYGVILSGVVTIIVNKRLLNQNYEIHQILYRANNMNIKRPYFIVDSVSIDGQVVEKTNNVFEEKEAPIKGNVKITLKNIGDGIALNFEKEGFGGVQRRKPKTTQPSIVVQEGECYIFNVSKESRGYIQYKNMIGIIYKQELQVFIGQVSEHEKCIRVFNLSEQIMV